MKYKYIDKITGPYYIFKEDIPLGKTIIILDDTNKRLMETTPIINWDLSEGGKMQDKYYEKSNKKSKSKKTKRYKKSR
jgi:hypothetical protein